MRKVKIRMARKAVLAALMATLQWSTVAFLQQSTKAAFAPRKMTTTQRHTPRNNVVVTTLSLSNDPSSSSAEARTPTVTTTTAATPNPNRFLWFPTQPRVANPFVANDNNNARNDNNRRVETTASKTSLPPDWSAVQSFVQPLQNVLDDASSDWILSYADLRPDTPRTWAGQAFLATNLGYTLVGAILASQGELVLGSLVEVCSVASFAYHYTQLEANGDSRAPTVRLAVLLDYICALTSMAVAAWYLWGDLGNATPYVFVSVVLSLSCLGLSWIYDTGRAYMFFHSLWHLLGAYTGLLVGALHTGTNQAEQLSQLLPFLPNGWTSLDQFLPHLF